MWGGDGWTGSLVTVEGVAIVSWNMANYKLVYVREGLKNPDILQSSSPGR